MAEKRMFSKTIIDSDLFLDMPLTAQALYFHLSLRADDEGFINSPKKIMRITGTRDDDLKVLIAKQFIIPFESGVVVIKHWLIHNKIRKNRIKATFHKLEKEQLNINNDIYEMGITGEYCLTNDGQVSDTCQKNDGIGLGLGLGLDLGLGLGKCSSEKKQSEKVFSDDSQEMKICLYLFDLMQRNCKSKKPNLQTWCKYVDYMIRIDNRDKNDIKLVIDYSQNDEFWKSNIRSTKKLREKFETLFLRASEAKNKQLGKETDMDQLKRLYNEYEKEGVL